MTFVLVVVVSVHVVSAVVEGTRVCGGVEVVVLRSTPIVGTEAIIVCSAVEAGGQRTEARGIVGGEIIAHSTSIITITAPPRLRGQGLGNTIDIRPQV